MSPISYATISQPAQARIELSAAIALYHAMAMTFCLPQAQAALDRPHEVAYSSGLTAREGC